MATQGDLLVEESGVTGPVHGHKVGSVLWTVTYIWGTTAESFIDLAPAECATQNPKVHKPCLALGISPQTPFIVYRPCFDTQQGPRGLCSARRFQSLNFSTTVSQSEILGRKRSVGDKAHAHG